MRATPPGAGATAQRPQWAQPLLGTGQVRHLRRRPVEHRFAYPTYFLFLPMRGLRAHPSPALPRNRFGLISFHDADHGDGRADSLAWLEEMLQAEGVCGVDGEVWLHCYPRVLGHAFKPVSFWYCHRADGGLQAVVVEVNNTFGERHCYLLHGPDVAYGRELSTDKVFHVSPFCKVAGRYRFRFMHTPAAAVHPQGSGTETPPQRTVARIDHDDALGPLVETSVCGTLVPVTARQLRKAFFGMPLMTLGVIGRIHWQALQLWCKRVPWFGKPTPPQAFVSTSTFHRRPAERR